MSADAQGILAKWCQAEMMEDFSLTLKEEIRATSSPELISGIRGNAWNSLPHVTLNTEQA